MLDKLDTTTFRQPKEEGRPAYHPAMMIKVLLWGYATGVRSSRKIEEKLEEDNSVYVAGRITRSLTLEPFAYFAQITKRH
jgi:transposase